MADKQKKPVRVGSLRTIGQIASEMGKVYRACRKGDIKTADAMRLVSMLSHIRATVEIGDIELRIQQLEDERAEL